MRLHELDESLRTENPCWKGYHPVGTKKKNGRTVPNCVPNKNESVVIDSVIEDNIDEDVNVINLEFIDGTTEAIRARTRNPIKTVLSYLIRRKEIERLKQLKSIDGQDVTGIVNQIVGGKK